MAGGSVTKTSELFGVARSTVLKVIPAFETEEKSSSLKQNSGTKRTLSDRNNQTFTQIVRKDHKNIAPKNYSRT